MSSPAASKFAFKVSVPAPKVEVVVNVMLPALPAVNASFTVMLPAVIEISLPVVVTPVVAPMPPTVRPSVSV